MTFMLRKYSSKFRPGTHNVEIKESEYIITKNENGAIRLVLESIEEHGVRHSFVIPLTYQILITKLLNLTYQTWNIDNQFEESDFIGIRMRVEVIKKGEYLNISDIGPLENTSVVDFIDNNEFEF